MGFRLTRHARQVQATLLGLAGCAPVLADVDQNQQVLESWAQAAGGAAPALVSEGGGTRLEWQVQTQSEGYDRNVVTPANTGALHSPFEDGGHSKHSVAFHVRSSDIDGGALFLQSALLASNDRAVLSKYAQQVSSFQLGGTGTNYQWAAGDVAAAYSQLGSNLGLRGLSGQLRLGSMGISAHAGTVAESWEALTKRDPLNGQPARSSYLRDVYGVKLDLEAVPGWRLFVTTQAYEDRPDSLQPMGSPLPPAQARSHTLGATYQAGDWTWTVEAGTSRFVQGEEGERSGGAALTSLVYRTGAFTWRAGFNDIGATYAAVGAMAAPGVQEGYGGVDWQATPSITLGLDLRSGAQRTAATAISAATRAPFDALTLRGGFQLGDWVQGLSAQLQDMRSRQRNPQGGEREMGQTQLGLSFSRGLWYLMAGLTHASADDSLYPAADTRARGWQASVGRSWNGDPAGLPWSVAVQLMANGQLQQLLASGQGTRTQNAGLSLTAQHATWGSLALSLQAGTMTQPMGGPELRQLAVQLDASYPLTKSAALKGYWRHNERNAGSPTLNSEEQVGGVHLGLTF
jgi:hypothetical protein